METNNWLIEDGLVRVGAGSRRSVRKLSDNLQFFSGDAGRCHSHLIRIRVINSVCNTGLQYVCGGVGTSGVGIVF